VVDHGAQYFTASQEPFEQLLREIGPETILELAAPLKDFHGQDFTTPRGARYYHREGNNRLGKFMGAELEAAGKVLRETEVDALEPARGGRWRLRGGGASQKTETAFDAVVLTPPWPQTLRILQGSEMAPADASPTEVPFLPNLTGLFEYDGEPSGPAAERYALVDLENTDAPLAWSACENHKEGRVRAGKTVFVAQASRGFSEQYLEEAPEKWLKLLRRELEKRWNLRAGDFTEHWGHRWRFARADESLPKTRELPKATQNLPPGIYIAGDTRVKSRVEAAFMDGWNIGGTVWDGLE
jgi:hypothetical protein